MAEAPGSLYTAGGGLLEAAGGQASNIGKNNQDSMDTLVKAGAQAESDSTAGRQQMTSQQAQMAIEKMKLSENNVTITPQLALGLAKNTGDKEWIKSTGTQMRADVLMSLYTHGLQATMAKQAPRIIHRNNPDGTIQEGIVHEDADGTVQEYWPGVGIKPDKLHPPKGGGGGTGSKDTSLSKGDAAFMKSQEKDAAFFGDASKSEQLKATNPEEWGRRHEQYLSNQDRYDELRKNLGKSGEKPAPAAAGGSSGAPDNSSPFDADAFIKDALGQ